MAVKSLGHHGLFFLALSSGAYPFDVAVDFVSKFIGHGLKLVGSGRHDLP